MKADVYNLRNEKVGEMELPDRIFGAKWRPALVAQVLQAQLANARRPWAHAKTRAEVKGGGRKPWRQKGTGRARHGSIRSPLWVGGGKAHGPTRERDYSQKINKKMKQAALFSALSRKLKESELKIFDAFAIAEPKTKILFPLLRTLAGTRGKSKKLDALLISAGDNENLFRASGNLVKTRAVDFRSLNLYDIMNHKNIFCEKAAAEKMAQHYSALK